MGKIIAKWFNLYTGKEVVHMCEKVKAKQMGATKDYYQRVVDEMARTGTISPHCDLQLPKKSMVVLVMTKDDNRQGEVLAKEGRWLRLPSDREKVIIRYI